MTQFDTGFVCSQFPAFSEPTLQGWAFFENAGGSCPAAATVRRLHEFYTRCEVQPCGPCPASRRAGAPMDEAHQRLATCLNAGRDKVHFGHSTSQNTYVPANALRPMMAGIDRLTGALDEVP